LQVAGLGGSLPHVGSDGELQLSEFNQKAGRLLSVLEHNRRPDSTLLLMTHEPPTFENLATEDGELMSGGSAAILDLAEHTRPDLVLSGHYHEIPGLRVSPTGVKFLNPGALAMYRYAKIDDNQITPEMCSLDKPRFDFVNFVYSRRPRRSGERMRLSRVRP
jgi:Icc-related predicted phosphoesterase